MRGLALSVLLLGSALVHAAATPPNDKQQVLWDHLRDAVVDVEQGLDGVLGVAILGRDRTR